MAGQPQANMEEILSSIRTTLEEETARVVNGEPADSAVDMTDEEILALSEMDILPEEPVALAVPADGAGAVVDLEAFASSGAVTMTSATANEDVLGLGLGSEGAAPAAAEVLVEEDPFAAAQAAVAAEVAPPQVEGGSPSEVVAPADGSDDAFDKLLNEIKLEKETSHADRVESLLGDEAEAAQAEPEVAEVAAPEGALAAEGVQRLELAAIPGPTGLQVALPAEVLAEALRPLISQWLSQNLPGVVEQMVREEILKITKQ